MLQRTWILQIVTIGLLWTTADSWLLLLHCTDVHVYSTWCTVHVHLRGWINCILWIILLYLDSWIHTVSFSVFSFPNERLFEMMDKTCSIVLFSKQTNNIHVENMDKLINTLHKIKRYLQWFYCIVCRQSEVITHVFFDYQIFDLALGQIQMCLHYVQLWLVWE